MSRPRRTRSVLVTTWAGGGNLPPLLAVGELLVRDGWRVHVLASAATRGAAERLGLDVLRYVRAPDPDEAVPFEAQAETIIEIVSGRAVAEDVLDAIAETDAALVVADCMLPAATAAAQAAAVTVVSVVHFLYGTLRAHLVSGGSWWEELPAQVNRTRARLGLEPVGSELEAWETADRVLVTAPRWFDRALSYPPRVVHAGPLGVRVPRSDPRGGNQRPHVLVSFSTTVMAGQEDLLERVCDAVADLDVDATVTLGGLDAPAAVVGGPNLRLRGYDDHDRLLPRSALVVTHGGLGTVLRAAAHGVPALILPLGRDQPVNAERIASLGAGVSLPASATALRVRAEIERMLADRRFADRAKALAARIAADEPERRAADLLRQAAAAG